MIDTATTRKLNELWMWYKASRATPANRARFKRGQVIGRRSRYVDVELVFKSGANGTDTEPNSYVYDIYTDRGKLIEADVSFTPNSRHEYTTWELGELVAPGTWGVGYYNDNDELVVVMTNEQIGLIACPAGGTANVVSDTLPVISTARDNLVRPNFHANFNGTNSYIDLGNPSELQITGALTISAWVRSTATLSGVDMVGKYNASASNRGYLFYCDSAAASKVSLRISSDGAASVVANGATTFNDGEWHHVAGVYVPSTSITVYLDGIVDGSETASVPASIFNSTLNAAIGARNGSSASNFFDGDIKYVRIYNRALADFEIHHIFSGYSITNALVGKWDLNTDSTDSSDNSNDGTDTAIIYRSN